MKFIRYIMILFLIYSLVPNFIAKNYLDLRVGGLPVSYIPFLLVFVIVFYRSGFKINKGALVSFRWLLAWFLVVLLSFTWNYLTKETFNINAFLIDLILIAFYIFVVYFGVLLHCVNKGGVAKIEQAFEVIVKYMVVIVLVGGFRHFLFDSGSVPFFNLFNPLSYRLFEVLLLVFTIPLAVSYHLITKTTTSLIFVLILIGGLLLAGSRTGYIAFLFLVPVLIYFGYVSVSGVLKISIPIVIIAFVFTYNSEIAKDIYRLDMIKQYFNVDFEKAVADGQVVRRIGMIEGTKEMIFKNPFLGVGIGKENYFQSFPSYYLDYFHVGRPHNQYLTLAATTGLIGLTTFLLFLVSIIKSGFRSLKKSNLDRSNVMYLQFLIASNLMIFVLMIGYEFETVPFTWMIFALSNAYFYLTSRKLKR